MLLNIAALEGLKQYSLQSLHVYSHSDFSETGNFMGLCANWNEKEANYFNAKTKLGENVWLKIQLFKSIFALLLSVGSECISERLIYRYSGIENIYCLVQNYKCEKHSYLFPS